MYLETRGKMALGKATRTNQAGHHGNTRFKIVILLVSDICSGYRAPSSGFISIRGAPYLFKLNFQVLKEKFFLFRFQPCNWNTEFGLQAVSLGVLAFAELLFVS